MNRVLILAMALLGVITSYSQQRSVEGFGSFSIIALGKDGILIAADSRTSFYSPDDSLREYPVAYIDTTQKLFDGKYFGFSFTGKGQIGGKFTSVYAKEFLESSYCKKTNNPKEILYMFFAFIKSTYSAYLPEFFKIKILVGGYFGGYDVMCSAQYNQAQCSQSYFAATNNESDFQSYYSDTLTCAELKPLIEQSIRRYAQKRGEGHIGGDILFLQILPNGTSKWLHYVEHKNNYINQEQIFEDYKLGKFKINFTSAANKVKFDKKIILKQ
jgi:hypothetical protein